MKLKSQNQLKDVVEFLLIKIISITVLGCACIISCNAEGMDEDLYSKLMKDLASDIQSFEERKERLPKNITELYGIEEALRLTQQVKGKSKEKGNNYNIPILFLPEGILPLPGGGPKSVICILLDSLPNGQRLLIDSSFELWSYNNGAFYDLVSGINTLDLDVEGVNIPLE